MHPKFEIGSDVRDASQGLRWKIEDRIVDRDQIRYLCSRDDRATARVYLEAELVPPPRASAKRAA